MDPFAPCSLDLTYLVQLGLIIWFIILIILSVYLIKTTYICDFHQCKAYSDAAQDGVPGSKEYTLGLLDALFKDGIWIFPFVASAIFSPVILFLLQLPVTVYNMAIIFLISFLCNYAILLFMIHHYVNFIKASIAEYIEKTPSPPVNNNNKIT